MFIFTKGRKEIIPTVGTLISCALLIAFSLDQIYRSFCHLNSLHLIFAPLPLLLMGALIEGVKLGYVIARYIFGALAIVMFLGAFNPFSYMDVEAMSGSINIYIVGNLLAAAIGAFLFYSLGDHARLRNVFPKK